MKIRLIVLLAALPLVAADPAGFALWTAADLKGMQQKLETKIDGQKFASQQLEKFGNHYTMLAYRQGNGSAELHETEADLFVVEAGSARLVLGGKIVNPKTTAPHEIRGPSIQGGVEKHLSTGDIVHIPAKTPHQLLLDSKEFTYFVMKTKTE
jgi:mannose-6-phosphate isomerase-like protein (cupin superfamily)